jgi:hypothetical protein
VSRGLVRLVALVTLLLQGSGGTLLLHRAVAHAPDDVTSACCGQQCPKEAPSPAGEPSEDDCPTCDMLGTVVAALADCPELVSAGAAPPTFARTPGAPHARSARHLDGARAPPASI